MLTMTMYGCYFVFVFAVLKISQRMCVGTAKVSERLLKKKTHPRNFFFLMHKDNFQLLDCFLLLNKAPLNFRLFLFKCTLTECFSYLLSFVFPEIIQIIQSK